MVFLLCFRINNFYTGLAYQNDEINEYSSIVNLTPKRPFYLPLYPGTNETTYQIVLSGNITSEIAVYITSWVDTIENTTLWLDNTNIIFSSATLNSNGTKILYQAPIAGLVMVVILAKGPSSESLNLEINLIQGFSISPPGSEKNIKYGHLNSSEYEIFTIQNIYSAKSITYTIYSFNGPIDGYAFTGNQFNPNLSIEAQEGNALTKITIENNITTTLTINETYQIDLVLLNKGSSNSIYFFAIASEIDKPDFNYGITTYPRTSLSNDDINLIISPEIIFLSFFMFLGFVFIVVKMKKISSTKLKIIEDELDTKHQETQNKNSLFPYDKTKILYCGECGAKQHSSGTKQLSTEYCFRCGTKLDNV
jgi:hypothetical protein